MSKFFRQLNLQKAALLSALLMVFVASIDAGNYIPEAVETLQLSGIASIGQYAYLALVFIGWLFIYLVQAYLLLTGNRAAFWLTFAMVFSQIADFGAHIRIVQTLWSGAFGWRDVLQYFYLPLQIIFMVLTWILMRRGELR